MEDNLNGFLLQCFMVSPLIPPQGQLQYKQRFPKLIDLNSIKLLFVFSKVIIYDLQNQVGTCVNIIDDTHECLRVRVPEYAGWTETKQNINSLYNDYIS